MQDRKSNDSWLNESRATTWEDVLRPPRSSRRALLPLVAIAVAAILGVLAFNSWKAMRYQSASPSVGEQLKTKPSRSAITSEPTQKEQSDPAEPSQRVQRLTKCRSGSGVVAYSDGACPDGTVASEVLVKPDSNLADGMSAQAREASMRQNSAIAQSVLEHERRVAANVDAPGAGCAQLSALIASLDAAARQPLTAFEQDRIREQRQRIRDRQFRLRCG